MKREHIDRLLANDSSLYAQEGFHKDGRPKINHEKKTAFLAGAEWVVDFLAVELGTEIKNNKNSTITIDQRK